MNRNTDKPDILRAPKLNRRDLMQFAAGATVVAATGAIMPTISSATTNSTDQIWRWSAADIAAAINRGKISSMEATRSCLDRIAAANPEINAVVKVLADEAIASAEALDRATR